MNKKLFILTKIILESLPGDNYITLNSDTGIISKCYDTCLTCDNKPIYDENNTLLNQSCIECINGYHLLYETSNCYNDSILEDGYYYSSNDLKYHKCDIQCKTCEKNGNSLLISGTIFDDELPSFSKKELNLSAMELPYKNETELKCTVDKVIESNYTLNCKLKPNIKYEFDNSILYDNDKLLLINFEKGAESQITSDETETKIRRFFPKSSGKL